MKVTRRMLDRDLRVAGTIIRIINNTFTEARLRLFNKLMLHSKMKIRNHSIQYTEDRILRKDGTEMRVCIFRPLKMQGNVPGVLWLHGGGYAIGAPEMALMAAEWFFDVRDCVIIAPDYRLSVQASYPAALEDSYDALLWMKSHASELGISENQLMVGGDSAGGGLTAALTLYTRDQGEVAVAFQMPLYPMLDDRMTTASAQGNTAPLWNSKSNYNGWKLYLGELFGQQNIPYYAAPARATDYSHLPPTATFVGGLEPFRDETVQYVENLRNTGIAVDFEVFEGCFHAFEQICPKADISKKAIAFIKNSFKYAADHYFTNQTL